MAPETEIRNVVKTVLETEFSDLEFIYEDDKMHESLGSDGVARIATSPLRRYKSAEDANVREVEILVQFYLPYDLKVDPEQAVDPAVIEAYAEQFESTIKDPSRVSSDLVWYFVVDLLEYPEDPTGNMTRFEAQIRSVGTNTAQI